MIQVEISKLKCTRKNIGKKMTVWENTFRYGRKIVARIYEPCEITYNKFSVSVPVGCGYALCSKHDSFPEAVEKMGDFLEVIHAKYEFK